MRITHSMMSNNITRYLMRQSMELSRVQEQISTQQKINKPSDDPTGMREILGYRNKITTIDQYMDNIDRATTRLESTEITLKVIDDLIGLVREMSRQQAKGTTESRLLAADQLREIKDQLVDLANSKNGENYMFSGHKTDRPAFGHVVEVSGGLAGPLNFGLAADAANVTIEVMDEYGTVINTITPAGGGVDGENSVAWSGAVPPDGLYRFTVTASDAGSDVVDYATYNGDDGTVCVIIGEKTELSIKADGREIFTPAGGANTFEIIADLITALENDDAAAINTLTTQLDAVRTRISEFRAASAPKLFQLESTANFWSQYKPQLEQLKTRKESVDLNQAAMELNQLDLAYQSTIAAAARIIQPSLINFLK